jgi:hypothetical protein
LEYQAKSAKLDDGKLPDIGDKPPHPQFRLLGQQRFDSVIGAVRGTECLVPKMRTRRKKRKPSDWRFTIEQIGRELRDVYPARENLPPQLRALAKELKRKITARRQNRRRANEGQGG